jgi:hypothetical protein
MLTTPKARLFAYGTYFAASPTALAMLAGHLALLATRRAGLSFMAFLGAEMSTRQSASAGLLTCPMGANKHGIFP